MNQKQIGKFISIMRRQKGMTQAQLAQLLHVSDRAISKWENGRGLPDPSNMMMLAQVLGITVNELLSAGVIHDDMEFRKKAEENILSVMVSTSAMETMSLISLLVMITCVIPVVYISAYGFSTSGWIIGFTGLAVVILSAVQYDLIRRSIPKQKLLQNIFIRLTDETQIPANILNQAGNFERYGSHGYRGFSSRSCAEIKELIVTNCEITDEQIEIFLSPAIWHHSDIAHSRQQKDH